MRSERELFIPRYDTVTRVLSRSRSSNENGIDTITFRSRSIHTRTRIVPRQNFRFCSRRRFCKIFHSRITRQIAFTSRKIALCYMKMAFFCNRQLHSRVIRTRSDVDKFPTCSISLSSFLFVLFFVFSFLTISLYIKQKNSIP